MTEAPSIAEILSGGGVLAFAVVIWKTQQKIERLLERICERLVRIDERTYRVEVEVDETAPIAERAPRKRARTPVAGVRARTQTPFLGDGEDP